MMKAWILALEGADAPVQVIWQTGKYYEREMQAFLAAHPVANIWQGAFIDRMDYAYAAADLIISRAGASSISELCLLKKPVILVPSPNVAENHQYHNAMVLTNHKAAVVIEEKDLTGEKLVSTVADMLAQPGKLAEMGRNARSLSVDDSLDRIADALLKLVKTP